ncbi:MAG: hypothetical protein Q4E47_02080 [Candidatus Saccharibacteria bacterium]|nr:hypothetical protein [Candidatus Saccharibacteria bacterium]
MGLKKSNKVDVSNVDKSNERKPKIDKVVILAIAGVAVLVITFVVLLCVFIATRNNETSDSDENREGIIKTEDGYYIEPGEEVKIDSSIDLNEATGNLAYLYVRKVLLQDNNMYDGVLDEDQDEEKIRKTMANIDQIISDNNFSDQNLLDIISTEKAKVYINFNDTEGGWNILKTLVEKEGTMPNSVKYCFYYAMMAYHRANGNDSEVKVMQEKIDALPESSWS